MYVIEKAKLSQLFERISQSASLYMPINKDGKTDYDKWESGKEYAEDLNTLRSAKDLFFPQNENIVSFTKQKDKITIDPLTLPQEKTVIFGVRACDAKSFEVLDKVFMSEPADRFYTAKRENSVIITAACSRPDESCFCGVFGIESWNPGGDIATWPVGDKLFLEGNTEKGNALIEQVKDLLTDCSSDEVENAKQCIKNVMDQLPLNKLSLDSFGGDKTDALFNRPEWEQLSQSCLGCGTCTFVCPTCQCYDIKDYDTGKNIKRYRCWDSCMFSDFTMCAHGTNRPTQLQRFRQRFMHKLVYFPANNDGEFSCVGCGRCVRRCPISMNIAKVIKAFGGENK